MTITYLMDTARQAGLASSIFPIDEIGWDGRRFLRPDAAPEAQPLEAVFKLYPWEWMIREEFGKHLGAAPTIWIEPPWKMLLSNKGILPVLWELYPGHPNLLEAHFASPAGMTSWVKKPLLGREGANITLHAPGADIETQGDYGEEGFIYQALAPPKPLQGMFATLGSWVIGHQDSAAAAGIGIRESESPIITNTSHFVPHLFQ
jgi:glutathionylspermidine synthase